MFDKPNSLAGLASIIIVYLLIATLYAIQTPAWQAPDEPAHYNYVHELAASGQFPVLGMGDYDQAYLEQLKSGRFPADLSIAPVRYEAHQPPLYYLLAAALFLVTGGQLLPLRLLSVALGALFIGLVHEIVRLVYPHQPRLRLGAAAFVAFLPMYVALSASVNNDALAQALLAALLLGALRYVKQPQTGRSGLAHPLLLGLLLGLALITKVSAYVAAPVLLAALVIGWLRTPGAGRSWRTLAAQLALLFGPALLLALPWYVRNATLYGGLDVLGRRWHDTVVVGQLRTGEFLAQSGLAALLQRAALSTFDSFWGVFGWMGVWMDGRIYTALLALSIAITVGCVAKASTRHPPPATRYALALLILSALLTITIYLAYNLSFVQHQGRYLFPALPAIALAVALGWQEVLRPAVARWAAAALLVSAALALAWTGLSGNVNGWSVAILLAGSLACALWTLAWPRLSPGAQQRSQAAAFALPFAALVALDLLALYAFILPQLA